MAEPVLGTFITTSDFTTGATKVAGDTGIILFSGYEVTLTLILKKVGFDTNDQLNDDLFLQWVEGY